MGDSSRLFAIESRVIRLKPQISKKPCGELSKCYVDLYAIFAIFTSFSQVSDRDSATDLMYLVTGPFKKKLVQLPLKSTTDNE